MGAFDVVVLGGTPGGIAAAIAAARYGRSVAVVEYHARIGGMMTSGLGKSDVENRQWIGGLFKEFTEKVHQHYLHQYGANSENVKLCQDGYYAEPSVAEKVLEDMIAKHSEIKVMRGWRLAKVNVENGKLTTIELVNRETQKCQQLEAQVFIDTTYEGDLFAEAKARFRLGRESRDDFGEPHAGVIYYDYQNHKILPGSTGESDDRLPAYTYRLCLTTDEENAHVLTEPPENYDRENYVGYFEDLEAGRLSGPKVLKAGRGYHPDHFDTLFRAFSVTDIPNRKTDVNINPRPQAFPFPEENVGYVEGDDKQRLQICQKHHNLTLGLLWFLQNDAEVPAAHRDIAKKYHLPKDEWAENGHFPHQLYVREARRLVGEYTLTEHDMTSDAEASRKRHDVIAIGEFPIDSFPCRKRQPGDSIVLEGYLGMLDSETQPYGIPYSILIPEEVDGLIVPVAASTTHVADSSIRMEPTWMCLGQAAGTAAHLSLSKDCPPRGVNLEELQAELRRQKQVL